MIVEHAVSVRWFEECLRRERVFASRPQALACVHRENRQFDPVTGTLREFIDLVWLPQQATRLSERTLKRYCGMIRRSLLPVLGAAQLRELTTLDIATYLREIERSSSSGRVASLAAIVRSICRTAADLRLASIPLPSTTARAAARNAATLPPHTQMRLQPITIVTWFEDCRLREQRFDDGLAARAFVAANGRTFDHAAGTLAEYCDLVWLPARVRDLSRPTLQAYGTALRGGLLRRLGKRTLRSLATIDFAAYVSDERERGMDTASLKQRLAIIRSICRVAAARGIAYIPAP